MANVNLYINTRNVSGAIQIYRHLLLHCVAFTLVPLTQQLTAHDSYRFHGINDLRNRWVLPLYGPDDQPAISRKAKTIDEYILTNCGTCEL